MTRRALITGGAGELGRAAGVRLSRNDIDVITADIAPGADITLDVTDPAAAEAAVSALGQVDILVNGAGIAGPGESPQEQTPPDWRAAFAASLHGSVNMCRAAIPGMLDRGWGRIVNVTSALRNGFPNRADTVRYMNMAPYSAAQAAVIGFSKSLGRELATTGVVVNAITPEVIGVGPPGRTAPEVLRHIASLIPVGRLGRPEEVAELIAWLTSDSCSFSSGAVYNIGGPYQTWGV